MSDSIVADSSDCENDVLSTPNNNRVAGAKQTKRDSRKQHRSSVFSDDADALPDAKSTSTSPSTSRTPRADALSDITDSAFLNAHARDAVSQDDKRPMSSGTVQRLPEKPMDIAIRARAKPAQPEPSNAEPKPRMVITRLVLTNFKSYAGRQEVGPFHASFSSVVGPNGSGKSNVIDSLLFVFGFRASKMRQGKISSLIHNSANFPDLDHCEVEVHFEKILDLPSGHKQQIPGSVVVVSRRAFKNNSSKYYINQAESNFTTVTSMLREEGIDLDHKRFLILQGEVESIAQMKPKAANEHDDGLLEYLEDIIGTSKYKSPIDESAAEVDMLNEVCREKNARFEHVDREKSGLEGKKTAALAQIRDENDLAQKQAALWQIFTHECDDNINITNEAVAQIQEQLSTETESHRSRERDIKKLNDSYHAEASSLEKLKQKAQKIQQELTKADKETVKFEEKSKHLRNKLKRLDKTIATSHSAFSESTAYLERLRSDIERDSQATQSIEANLRAEEAALAQIREGLKGKTEGLSDQITGKQKALEPWYAQITEKKSAIAVAQSELDILRDREEGNHRAVQDAESRLEQLRDTRRAKDQELKDLEEEIRSARSSSKELERLMSTSTSQEPEARARLTASRQKVSEARASLMGAQSQGQVLKSLMRLSDSGRISGFHGRLGNLGAIDEKYDVAISTACPSLNNLVVDTVEVGQRCIDFLRKGNLGRANFILLDRLGQRDLGAIETPENVPRLFDLVKVKDEKFLPAFYSVLQNTLVATDLSQAQRVAYGAKRWRVVTLDGKVIDKSGTMSGGGSRPVRGAMSAQVPVTVSEEQVTKLEHDHEREEKRWQEFQQDRASLTASLKSAREKAPLLETKLQKSTLDVDSIAGDVLDMEKRLKELRSDKAPQKADRSQIDALQTLIQQRTTEIEELAQNTSGLESEIKALQEKILDIGGVKLRSQKAKVDGLKGELATLTEEISNAHVEAAKAEKATTKHSSAQDAAEKEMEQSKSEMDQLEAGMRDQDAGMAEVRARADEAQKAFDAKEDQMAELKKEVDAQSADLNEFRGKEIELKNSLEENQKVLQENGKRLKYWVEKLEKLKIQDVSETDASIEEQALPQYSRDELADLDKSQLKGEIAALEEKTQNSTADLGVLSEYRRRVDELAQRSADLGDAIAQRDAAKKRCEELRRIRLEGFMEGFSSISLRLKEMYQMITMGGNAELELVDSLDPFSEGILFSVMPPKKSWKNISNLSGGEKTLSSLALVFALHHYKPTPLYVMDEIDAALDFRNVSIVASYIKERTKNAQFIVISLRNNMFELASRLVGVYKVNHMTKSVTVENRDFMQR